MKVKVLDKALAEAIGGIIKDLKDDLQQRLDDIEQRLEKSLDRSDINKAIEDAHSATLAVIDERVQWARLDADLWKETSKNELRILRDDRDKLSETLKDAGQVMEDATKHLAECEALLEDVESSQLNPIGPWTGQLCQRGDVVMRDGASWVALRKTNVDPREQMQEPHWRLLSQRGQRGPKGQKGEPGPDGVHVVTLEAVDKTLALALSNGEVLSVNLGPMIKQALAEMIGDE